jgi:DNA invertase Pin-like site-specific DNA recombinase
MVMKPTTATKAAPKLITYVRVSTLKQGQSGLGLDGQSTAIKNYVASVNGDVIATYKEIETGKNNERVQLAKALAHAKRVKARLVIAKLDRLARNVHFVSGLMESRVDFVACDNPHANRLTIHILAAIAEHEAEAISLRTKAALEAAKARGQLLGSARPGHWKGREHKRIAGAAKARAAAAAAHTSASEPVYSEVRPIILEMRDRNESLRAIADRLNAEGHSTLRGDKWNKMQVSRLLSRV